MSTSGDDNFDFISAFMGVDILAVEAVAKIVGRVEATLVKELQEAGLSEPLIGRTMHAIHGTFFREMFAFVSANMPKGKGGP